MKTVKNILLFFMFVLLPCLLIGQVKNTSDNRQTEWIISRMIAFPDANMLVKGNPKVVDSKFGEAVFFDGQKDGIFIDEMPLAGLEQFTVEAIFRPDEGSKFEQRFFHCGEIKGSRVMLELRSTPKGWYFDAFINANGFKKTLVDSTLLHPSNQWYHVAFVVDKGKLTTYVNGKKELQECIPMTPFFTGKTSLGVRQNELSWFKGALYKIKILPKALSPDLFIKK